MEKCTAALIKNMKIDFREKNISYVVFICKNRYNELIQLYFFRRTSWRKNYRRERLSARAANR